MGQSQGGVVFASARGVGEGVVGVVDLLEAFCAGSAFGRFSGDAVGVVFEGCSVAYISKYVLICGLTGVEERRTSCRHRGFVVAWLSSRPREPCLDER